MTEPDNNSSIEHSGHYSLEDSLNMGGILNGDGQRGLYAQLQHFKEADEARNKLVQTIVDDFRKLETLYQQKCADYDSEQTVRRHWQDEQGRARRELVSLRQQTESNPFALVIIDGDGVMFREDLLQGGAAGGAKAAFLLYQEILQTLESYHEDANNWSIIVQVFANLDGLSRKLMQIGLIQSPQELHSFARAFSCNQPLFSFVDVGMGKERADHKMKETFRLFLKNINCKHIIFGGCHDNGYLPNLEPYSQDRGVANRVTLLESTPAERGYHKLGFDVTRFTKVFRSDSLQESRQSQLSERSISNHAQENWPPYDNTNTLNGYGSGNVFATSSPTRTLTPSTLSTSPLGPIARPALSGRTASSNLSQGLTGQNGSAKSNPTAPPPKVAAAPPSKTASAFVSTTPPKPAPTSTYAKPGSVAPPPAKTINIATTKPAPRKFILLNVSQQRIDKPLQKPEDGAAKALASRIKQAKVCNNFHLLGKCSNGDYCSFTHAPKLCASELIALRSKARERPCTKSGACRDLDCVSGHHCPRVEACESKWCMYEDSQHYVDSAVKFKEYENGDLESVS